MPPFLSAFVNLLIGLVPWGTQTVRNWVILGTLVLVVIAVLVAVVGITFLFPQDSPDTTFTRRVVIGLFVIASAALVAIILCAIVAEVRRDQI